MRVLLHTYDSKERSDSLCGVAFPADDPSHVPRVDGKGDKDTHVVYGADGIDSFGIGDKGFYDAVHEFDVVHDVRSVAY